MTHRISCDNQTALNPNKNANRVNRILETPPNSSAPCHSRSKSRQKRISASKLFAKAHQTNDGETYLVHTKSAEGSHGNTARLSGGHCSDCTHSKKAKSLEMCLEYNIKIGGEMDNHSLSMIIGRFCGIGND